ncbi:MAG: hypothetical protein TEF_05365 [Rhizobiales bacterium NRL2]|nr:MAG: hypothetical protein TEF_05365 [Rhizobiales bacterium NRL2]
MNRTTTHGQPGADGAAIRRTLDIAEHLRLRGRFAEALPLYRHALEKGVSDETVLEALRTCCTRLSVPAAAEFERVLAARPDFDGLRLHLLEEHRRSRNHPRVLEIALAAPEPRLPLITERAAESALQLGRDDQARQLFEELLVQDPDNPVARRGLARLEARVRRFDKVLDALDEAEGEAGPDIQTLDLSVSAHRRLGQTAEAARTAANGVAALLRADEGLAVARLLDRFRFPRAAAELRERTIGTEGQESLRRRRRAAGHLLADGRVSDALLLYRGSGDPRWRRQVPQTQRRRFEDIARALGTVEPEAWPYLADHVVVLPDIVLRWLVGMCDRIRPYGPPGRGVVLVSGTLGAGGAERQLAKTALGLARRRAGDAPELAVATLQDPGRSGNAAFGEELAAAGVEVLDLFAGRNGGAIELPVPMAPAEPLLALLPANLAEPIAGLCRLFERRRPAVAHGWQDMTGAMTALAALLAGVPRIIIGTRSLAPDRKEGRNRPYLRDWMRLLAANPRVTLLNNSLAGRRDYARWLGAPVTAIRHLPNGYDFDAMRHDIGPALPSGGRVVIGGVMRMTEEKRPELWLEAVIELCRRHRHVDGRLVGDGPMRARLEGRLAESGFGDRIVLAGRRSDMWAQYAAMDLLLLTSRTEGLPNVLIEAQSFGRPVAATPSGGAAETFVDGETGILLPRDGPGGIADALEALVSDADMRYRFGERAAAFVRREFGLEAMIDRTLALYGWPARDGDRRDG